MEAMRQEPVKGATMQGHKPYKFKRITGAELSAALQLVGLTAGQFCRLTGSNPKRVGQWLNDEEECPPWVPPYLAALTVPEAMQAARARAEALLLQDAT